MADYYPLISQAVGALDKSKEARRALYDHARELGRSTPKG
jgi:hypothetical protein